MTNQRNMIFPVYIMNADVSYKLIGYVIQFREI